MQADEGEDRIDIVQRELFLRALAPTATAARQLAHVITDTYFPEGTLLYREGDEPAEMYYIVRGQVRCEREGEEPWLFGQGDVVGIFDLNLERPRARTAVAVTDVSAMMLKAEDLFEVQEDNFDYTKQLLWRLAQSLHEICLTLSPNGGFAPPEHDDWELAEGLEMNLVERIGVLRDSLAFEGASIQSLVRLAGQFEVLRLAEHEVLFEPDSAHKEIYVVACGQIAVERQRDPPLSGRFGTGAMVCGFAALGDIELEYRAWAHSPQAIVLRIAEEDLVDVMEDHFDVVRSLFKGMTRERERLMLERARRSLDPVGLGDGPGD